MTLCAYCNERPAVHRDHLITKSQARRRPEAQAARNDPRFIVKSCADCNWLKGTRLLVPASHAELLGELGEITKGYYRAWHGDRETLRTVAK